MKAGHGGFACASCTDFFGLFLLACRLASARVLVMWDGYVERPWDLDSDRVLYIYINMVPCVLRVLCALASAAARRPSGFMVRAACNIRRAASIGALRVEPPLHQGK